MTDVVLIQPSYNLHRIRKLSMKKAQLEAPLPLVYIAPYLLRAGFQVRIFDLSISPSAELGAFLAERHPVVAGISVMPGIMLHGAIRLARFIRRHSPSTRVVWGGSFPSLHYELCLRIPEVDFVVCGDGEETLAELAGVLAEGGDPGRVAGLAFRRDGAVCTTEPRRPAELEREPVGAWELLDPYMPDYLGPAGFAVINTARGCPFRCYFCYNTVLYKGFKRYRTKAIPAVLEEVDYLTRRFGVRKLKFTDDDYLADRERGLELLDALRSRHPQLRYHLNARADELLKRDSVASMATAGVDSVFIGAETGSAELLRQIEKGHGTHEIIEAARAISRHGVAGTFSFTCGYPNETREDLYRTVRMAKVIKDIDPRHQSQVEIVSPIAGTRLFEELQAGGQMPGSDVAAWCDLTNWKTSRGKPWIADGRFYEAFQLAFYLAFLSSHDHGGMRLHTRAASGWSTFRLLREAESTLPEFRAADYLLKRLLWGLEMGGDGSAVDALSLAAEHGGDPRNGGAGIPLAPEDSPAQAASRPE